jgi:hypothetical protein
MAAVSHVVLFDIDGTLITSGAPGDDRRFWRSMA